MPFGGLLTSSIIGGAGSLFGGLFGKSASGQYAQQLQKAQQFLQGQEQQGLQNYAPWQTQGQNATYTLGSLLGTPGKGLLQNWNQQFTAPTAAQAEATPGYQFQLQQGENAIQNAAAGRGNLLSGRTMADLNNFAQGTASENYQNVFNNALTQYQSAYQTFLNNQNNTYNRLLGLSGMGLQAAGGEGQLISGIGGDIASLYGQQGAAQAGGTMALGQGIGGLFSTVGNGLTLANLNGGGGGGGGDNPPVLYQSPTQFQT